MEKDTKAIQAVVFVRKTRTGSGAVAVQAAEKRDGKLEIIKHFGSAHTDADLGVLLAQARAFVGGDQPMLNLDVPEPIHRIADVADWRSPELLPPAPRPTPGLALPGRIGATSSRLIYEVLGAVYDQLGFKLVGDDVFRDLAIARIIEPTSKADTQRVLDDLGAEPPSYKAIQRHLAMITPGGYRDIIADHCFDHAADTGGLSLILYDVTTLYFEAEKEDDLRKVCFSKERRVDPQIVVGLLEYSFRWGPPVAGPGASALAGQ